MNVIGIYSQRDTSLIRYATRLQFWVRVTCISSDQFHLSRDRIWIKTCLSFPFRSENNCWFLIGYMSDFNKALLQNSKCRNFPKSETSSELLIANVQQWNFQETLQKETVVFKRRKVNIDMSSASLNASKIKSPKMRCSTHNVRLKRWCWWRWMLYWPFAQTR